jgi:hypothetical protein
MKDPKTRKPETRPVAPRAITLLDVLNVVRSVAETDAEAAATLEYMLRSGTVRFLSEDALAA